MSGVNLKVTYKWVPRQYGLYPPGTEFEEPPAKLNFVLRGSVNVYATSKAYQGAPVNGRDTSGEKVSASIDSKSTPEDALTRTYLDVGRLFSFDTQGQTEFSAILSASGEASVPGNRGSDRGEVGVDIQSSSELDDRSVTLTRDGAHDERLDEDGTTIHGDTIYSYTYYFGTMTTQGQSDVLNTQEFVANLGGDWTEHEVRYDVLPGQTHMVKGTDHQWSPRSEHSHSPDDWNKASFDIPYGNKNLSAYSAQPKWEGSPTGKAEETITYTVHDNRNGEGDLVAKPKYVLHIHDQVELDHETTEAARVNVILYNSNGQYIVTSDDPNGTKAGQVGVEAGTSSSSGWSAGASFDVSKWIDDLGLDFQYQRSNEQSTTTTATLGFDVPPGQKAYAMVTHEYIRHHKYVYLYDTGGRIVRMGRSVEGDDAYNVLREVPHEAFADEAGPAGVSPPFWAGPIPKEDIPRTTSNQPPPFKSDYTS